MKTSVSRITPNLVELNPRVCIIQYSGEELEGRYFQELLGSVCSSETLRYTGETFKVSKRTKLKAEGLEVQDKPGKPCAILS